MTPEAFIRANAGVATPPLVPEILLHLATEVVPLWRKTEKELEAAGVPPPYWAFAWAGGQVLARYILDHPQIARGRKVLDFGSGSGLVAIAAAKAGAARVTAADIDPFAMTAIALNATANNVTVEITRDDLIGSTHDWNVILVGDMCYERPLAERLLAWLRARAASGTAILLGDPGRAYLPQSGLEKLGSYDVPVSRELEDKDMRATSVYRLSGGG
jgi:predicted nicotinamide N-methyase